MKIIMLNLVIILYIIFSFLLISLILINKGKGAETGGITSSENDIFGSRGSSSLLNKVIVFIALFLLLLNILINIINNNLNKNDVKANLDIKQYEALVDNPEKLK